jgi:hypothetical protein
MKTPKDRADYMAQIIRKGQNTSNNRRFHSCLENGDALEVIEILKDMASRGPLLASNLPRYIANEYL